MDVDLNCELINIVYVYVLPLDYKLFSRVKQVTVNNPLVHYLEVRPDRFHPEREEQRHLGQ